MAGSSKDPAFLLYCTTWLQSGDVASLSLEQQGAYMRLLCFAWLDGSIPAAPDELQHMLGVTEEVFGRIWPKLSRRWSEVPGTPGRLINKRQEEERAERKRKAEEMRERGQAGGKRSAEQRASGPPSRGQAEGQAEPQAESKPSTSTSRMDGWMDGGDRTSSQNQNGEGVRTRSSGLPARDVVGRIVREVGRG